MSTPENLPKGVGYLQVIQAVSTISFGMLYSSMTLYVSNQLGLSQTYATSMTGVLFAFAYAFNLFGGLLGGRFLSSRRLFYFTNFFKMVGIGILSLTTLFSLRLGLAIYVLGYGMNVTTVNTMLSQYFGADDNRRERAFFINYAAMNGGFFIGCLLSGFFDSSSQYQGLFSLGVLTDIITFIILSKAWSYLKEIKPISHPGFKWQTYAAVFVAIPLVYALVSLASTSHVFILSLGGAAFVSLFVTSLKQNAIDKRKFQAFLVLSLVSVIYWMVYFTGPMGVAIFIKHNVNRHIGSFLFATQWLQDLNTLLIMLGCPLVASMVARLNQKGHAISVHKQFLFSFALLAMSYSSLSLGILFSDHKGYSSLSWPILYVCLKSVSELFLAPVGFGMIREIAPEKYHNVFMGSWMMVCGVAATLSHFLSTIMVSANSTVPYESNPHFLHAFNQCALWALLGLGLLVLATPLLGRNKPQQCPLAHV